MEGLIKKKHGLSLEEPEYDSSAYLEKQNYMATQEKKLEELTMKIKEVEALVDEITAIVYDKAVEVAADTVKLETHKEDINLEQQSKAGVSPLSVQLQRNRVYIKAIGWCDYQNHKHYKINHSETPNHVDEVGRIRQKQDMKF